MFIPFLLLIPFSLVWVINLVSVFMFVLHFFDPDANNILVKSVIVFCNGLNLFI